MELPEDMISLGLELESYGFGMTHLLLWTVTGCERCQATGLVGSKDFPVMCPKCFGKGEVTVDG